MEESLRIIRRLFSFPPSSGSPIAWQDGFSPALISRHNNAPTTPQQRRSIIRLVQNAKIINNRSLHPGIHPVQVHILPLIQRYQHTLPAVYVAGRDLTHLLGLYPEYHIVGL